MSAGAFDPRHNRSIGNESGLARRVQEMERRLNSLSATQGDYPASIVPAGKLAGSGAHNAGAPPNSTSGTTFTVPMTGFYLCRTDATAYVTALSVGQVQTYIDGVSVGIFNELSFDQINVQQTLLGSWFFIRFTTIGTHYHWLRQLGNVASGAGTRWSFVYMRVGAV